MHKIRKLLTIYFISFLISTSIFLGNFDQVVDFNEEKIIFKKENNSYVPSLDVSIGAVSANSFTKKTSLDKKSKEHDLVIFIHGTILPFPSLSAFVRTLKGNKKSPLRKKSFFYKYMNNIRYNGIFKYQPINATGLKKINLDEKKSSSVQEKSSKKIAGYYENYCKLIDTNKSRSFYTFGWSGHLNQGRREGWSDNLYRNLIREIEKIKKSKNKKINISILAHSHGGNVALKLVDAEKKYKKGLKIKNLVLFGTPVQRETSQAIYSDMFDKIYNIYSRGDPVQVIDFISTKDIFSKRKFWKKNGVLPARLVQIEILCGKLKPMHNEFWFLKERWNFFYRKRLSVSPFPISIFTPEIVKIVDKNFAHNSNLQLNIEKEKSRYKLSFKNLDKTDSTYEYFVDFPQA